jgi:hypothetical protein
MKEVKEIQRNNAFIPEHNREEVQKYEQALMRINRNRLKIQQQPYENDYDDYDDLLRLKHLNMIQCNMKHIQQIKLQKT